MYGPNFIFSNVQPIFLVPFNLFCVVLLMIYYIILDMQYFDSSVSFMYFLDVVSFRGLHSSHLNCTWLIEYNKYFLTDRISKVIKF